MAIRIIENNILDEYVKRYKLKDMFSIDISEYMYLYRFNKNEYICVENDKLDNMFFLVDGKAKVYKNLENGKSLLVSFYNPLTIIGDVEFVNGNLADCSVQVIKETYCIGINLNLVRNILMKDCKFLLNICAYLGEKLSNSSNNNSINLLYPLENRLASFILASFNINDNKSMKFTFEESYHEISELLGTSYRHLNRTLNKFCADEIIQKNGKEYTILNYDKIVYLAGDLYK